MTPFNGLELFAVVLGSGALAATGLWVRNRLLDWHSTRHHREQDRRPRRR